MARKKARSPLRYAPSDYVPLARKYIVKWKKWQEDVNSGNYYETPRLSWEFDGIPPSWARVLDDALRERFFRAFSAEHASGWEEWLDRKRRPDYWAMRDLEDQVKKLREEVRTHEHSSAVS